MTTANESTPPPRGVVYPEVMEQAPFFMPPAEDGFHHMRWGEIYLDRHTRLDLAHIAAAIANADAVMADSAAGLTTAAGPPFERGSDTWCQVASNTFDHYLTHPIDLPPTTGRCFVDPDIARIWLGAPSVMLGHFDRPVAEVIGLTDRPTTRTAANVDATEVLVATALDMGLIALDGHQMRLHRLVPRDGVFTYDRLPDDATHREYLITIRPDHGPKVSGISMNSEHLDSTLTGIDAAIDVLTTVAARIDSAMAQTPQPAPDLERAATPTLPPAYADVPHRIRPDGQAFPALSQIRPAATTPDPPPPNPEPGPDRRR